MRPRLLFAVVAVTAASASAVAIAAPKLNETSRGRFSVDDSDPNGLSVITMTGKVKGVPIDGPMTGTLKIDFSGPIGGPCGGNASAATGTVTLRSKGDRLVLKETGQVCDLLDGNPPTYTGTWKVNGTASSGRFKRSSGSGKSTLKFVNTSDSTGTFVWTRKGSFFKVQTSKGS